MVSSMHNFISIEAYIAERSHTWYSHGASIPTKLVAMVAVLAPHGCANLLKKKIIDQWCINESQNWVIIG